MNILLPKTITAASFGAATDIPEVDPYVGEIAWVAGPHTKGDRRAWKGYIYECVKDITSSPDTAIEPDSRQAAALWLKDETAPTNRMAPFDKYLFTKARRKGSLTYEIVSPFADGIAIYGIDSDNISITVRDDLGNDLVPPVTKGLWQQAFGPWEYLFGDLAAGTYFTLKNIPVHPRTTFKITLYRNDPDVEVSVGHISVGQWQSLLAPTPEPTSGAQYGVSSTTKDYSYTEDNPDGTYSVIPGPLAKNISVTCVIDSLQAPAADALLTRILGLAVAIEISNLSRYSHLATVARVTGSVRNVTWSTAEVELQIKGNP